MNNNYWGQNRTFTGTSYLSVTSAIDIQENVSIGGTNFVFNRGSYDVTSFTLNNNTIKFSLENKVKRINRTSGIGNRIWKSGYIRNYRLNSSGDPKDDLVSNNSITSLTNNSTYRSIGTDIVYNTKTDWENSFIALDFAYRGATIGAYQGIVFRSQNISDTSSRQDYFIGLLGNTSNGFLIAKTSGGTVMTTLSSASFTPGNSIYNLIVYSKNGNLYGAIGLNQGDDNAPGITYNTQVFAKDLSYTKGSVGIMTVSGVTVNSTFERFVIADLEEPLNYQDVNNKSVLTSGVNFSMPLNILNSFQSSGNWSTGISNQELVGNLITTNGASYDWIIQSGNSTINFSSFEFEFRGQSGLNVGALFGSSKAFISSLVNIGSTNASNMLYMLDKTYYEKRQSTNPFTFIEPDTWNKIKAIFYYDNYQFYVNGELFGSILYGSLGASVFFENAGIVASQTGLSGSVLEFRNFKTHTLYSPTSSIEITSGSKFGSLMSRYIPAGYQFIYGSTNLILSSIGNSKLTLGVTNLINPNLNYNLKSGIKASITRGDIFADASGTEDPEIFQQADVTITESQFDSNITINSEADLFNDGSILDSQSDRVSLAFSHIGLPFIEKLDRVFVNNIDSGVSFIGIVFAHNTNFSADNGAYQTQLDLRKVNPLAL